MGEKLLFSYVKISWKNALNSFLKLRYVNTVEKMFFSEEKIFLAVYNVPGSIFGRSLTPIGAKLSYGQFVTCHKLWQFVTPHVPAPDWRARPPQKCAQ